MKDLKKLIPLVLIYVVLIISPDCRTNNVPGKSDQVKHYEQGIKYGIQGEFEAAKAEFEKALKLDSLNIIAKGFLQIAEDVLNQKIKSETGIHLFKGADYANKGNWDEVIEEINKALEINLEYASAYIYRGSAYFGKGLYDRAIADYNTAIEINPELATAFNNRGLAYNNKGLYDQAIDDYNKAIEINPGYAMAFNNRGVAYDNKGLYDRGIADFNKAIEINPGLATPYNNRAFAYENKGFYDQAIDDYNKAIEINPEFAEVYFNKADACDKVGRAKEAVEAYKNFIQYSPPNAPPIFRGRILQAKQRIKRIELDEKTKMHISAILVKTKTEAQEILQKLNSGANFSELAKQYSIGPGKEKGGDLGYFAPGDMMKELNDVAVKLKVGQCSGIIETSDGYFVIKKTGGITPSITRE
jgi:tetratricopeptide (TPR) repeat protein